MYSVTFFLGSRHKTITGNMPQDCWITFKKDFNEAREEIIIGQVVEINDKNSFLLNLNLIRLIFKNRFEKE